MVKRLVKGKSTVFQQLWANFITSRSLGYIKGSENSITPTSLMLILLMNMDDISNSLIGGN